MQLGVLVSSGTGSGRHLLLRQGDHLRRLGVPCECASGSPSTCSSGSQFSHDGRYQFHLPSTVMLAGTTIIRMRVASISRATPTPKPICWNITRSPAAKPAKTATMISAAPVMMRPVTAMPCTTASTVSPLCR